tara:strand:- start:960 stop:1169 length:210 start_codon:yes stop_codon:yes gene_type:complete
VAVEVILITVDHLQEIQLIHQVEVILRLQEATHQAGVAQDLVQLQGLLAVAAEVLVVQEVQVEVVVDKI